MFYSAVVAPGKPVAFVPPPEEHMLHLSQACLAHDAREGTRASLLVRAGPDEEPAVLCTLTAGRLDTVPLDQFFAHYAEFTVAGGAKVHLSGYYAPQHEPMDGLEHDEDEDEDEDDDPRAVMLRGGHPMVMPPSDSDDDGDDSDSDDDEGDEDEDSEDFDDEDLDEDELDEDELAAAGWPAREPSAVIEEIEDLDEGDKGKKGAGKAAQQQQGKAGDKRKAQQAAAEPAGKKQAVAATAAQQQDKQQQKAAAKADKQAQQQQQKTGKDKPEQAKQQQQQQQPKTPATAGKQQAPQQEQQQAQAPATAGKRAKPRVYDNGFEVHELRMGQPDGRVARAGKRVLMRYVGRLAKNGKVFDSNTKGKPFAFRLGVGEVIKGWDRGVEGMRVGDKRKLVVPPQMAYGSQALPGIPPNSTLEFDVELVDVK